MYPILYIYHTSIANGDYKPTYNWGVPIIVGSSCPLYKVKIPGQHDFPPGDIFPMLAAEGPLMRQLRGSSEGLPLTSRRDRTLD